jgi:hypothetical protein
LRRLETMKFEVKKTGTIMKALGTLNSGDVFYIPRDDIYCMRVKDVFTRSDYVKAIDLTNGFCHLYKFYEEVVPVTMKTTIENPYLHD